MTQPNEGGPAFPGRNTGMDYNPGMTLRDWFAGQALSALAAKTNPHAAEPVRMQDAQRAVHAAYEIADEALRVRMKDIEEE